MLIRNADIPSCCADPGSRGHARLDVRLEDGCIAEIGSGLKAARGTIEIDAEGAVLLPGLHDHHIHLRSLAAALASVVCGPPEVSDEAVLIQRLQSIRQDPTRRPTDWIRGVAYHESVAGEIERSWLDRVVPDRAIRIQHRSGRLWILNSLALQRLGVEEGNTDTPLERQDGVLTGRLYDADGWLRERMGGGRQNLGPVSRWLAGFGVTGLTETTPTNTRDDFNYFAAARQRGELLQDVLLMGDASLDDLTPAAGQHGIERGPHKFHLHDHDLPDFEDLCAAIRRSHKARRAVAFHCVSRADLTFALSALREVGSVIGDRIEHASVTPPELMAQIAELGLTVVTQPNFISERGDAYLREVAAEDQSWLYRLRGFHDAGVALAGSTDAPFGHANPWKSMQAAVSRRAANGSVLGANECLSPEEALVLFMAPLQAPGRATRTVSPGQPADLCLLDRNWSQARQALGEVRVRLTFKRGEMIWPRCEPDATASPG